MRRHRRGEQRLTIPAELKKYDPGPLDDLLVQESSSKGLGTRMLRYFFFVVGGLLVSLLHNFVWCGLSSMACLGEARSTIRVILGF